jgi:hypothetical protein
MLAPAERDPESRQRRIELAMHELAGGCAGCLRVAINHRSERRLLARFRAFLIS